MLKRVNRSLGVGAGGGGGGGSVKCPACRPGFGRMVAASGALVDGVSWTVEEFRCEWCGHEWQLREGLSSSGGLHRRTVMQLSRRHMRSGKRHRK